MVTSRMYGRLPDERAVTMYTITNTYGEYVELLDFGAAIHGIYVKDRDEKLSNVLLQVDSAQKLAAFSTEAITIGRVANRIYRGRFVQNGKPIQLECNYKGEHFIHGASGNYAYQFFHAAEMGENWVRFGLYDSGAGGFGCGAEVSVTFTFGDTSVLQVDYEILPEADTVFSPTNHAYFNLGDGADAAEQLLWINAESYAPKGSSGMPEGEIRSVAETPLDFRRVRKLRDAFADTKFFPNDPKIDENMIISGSGMRKAAELYSHETGRGMVVYTDMPALVLFTPCIPRQPGDRAAGFQYRAVCLETQFVSNSVNCPSYTQPWCAGKEATRYSTRYVFYHETLNK